MCFFLSELTKLFLKRFWYCGDCRLRVPQIYHLVSFDRTLLKKLRETVCLSTNLFLKLSISAQTPIPLPACEALSSLLLKCCIEHVQVHFHVHNEMGFSRHSGSSSFRKISPFLLIKVSLLPDSEQPSGFVLQHDIRKRAPLCFQ